MKKLLQLLFLLVFSFHFSQSLISGKVISESNAPIPNVLVLNMRAEEKSISNSQGEFQISAQKGDEIRLIKKGYERNSIRIDAILEEKNIILKNAVIVIEEVEIDKFKPTGNLKKDSRTLNRPIKVIALNSDIEKFRKEPPTDFKRELKTPKEFELNPYKAQGQFNLLALVGLAYKLIKGKNDSKPEFYPSIQETQAFLLNLKKDLGEDYFKSMEISEAEIDQFLRFSNSKFQLAKRFVPQYNLEKIKVELEKSLIAYRGK